MSIRLNGNSLTQLKVGCLFNRGRSVKRAFFAKDIISVRLFLLSGNPALQKPSAKPDDTKFRAVDFADP